jgi:predicted lipoprotein with Yx(FWY)xxD motif
MRGRKVAFGTFVGLTAVLLMGIAGTAMAALNPMDPAPAEASVMDLGGGKFGLQNTFGQQFYVYDKDTAGTSNCLGKCAETWVPVYGTQHSPKSIGKTWTLIKRQDGYLQWAYDGQPLYTFGYGANEAPPTPADLDGHWHLLVP